MIAKNKWRFGIFSQIVNATFNVVKRLETYCNNMVMLKGNIWCLNKRNIFIYDRDFLLKNTLEFRNLKKMNSICYIGKGHVIIVDLTKGLHTINVNGDYVEEIVKGKFKFNLICQQTSYLHLYGKTKRVY